MAGTSLIKTIEASLIVNAGDSREILDDLAAKAEKLAKPWEIDITALTAEAQGAVDDVTEALIKYNEAAIEAERASADLAEVQAKDGGSADDLAAAQDRVAEATVRSLDAQMRLLAAEEKAAAGAKEEGDATQLAGDEQLKMGEKADESAGMMAGAWGKAKLAILGVGAGLLYGMYKAAGFQSQMTMLTTQAGVAKNQMGYLGAGVLDLAGKVGEDPDSLAQALYHVESSFQSVGITAPKALALVKTAAEGARTGGADLVDTTNALDATMVAKVPGIHSYSQAMGALNAIVGSGDMTMENLAQAMGSGVMAVAATYGQNIDQVGAAFATLGDNNIRGAKAATDLRMAWQALLDPIKAGLPLLKSVGLNDAQLGAEMTHHGMSAAIGLFIEHLKASKVPMADWGQYETEIFGKKAGVGIGIMISQYDRLLGKLPDIERGSKGFGDAWTQTEHTVGQQFHDLTDGAEALAIKLGEKLLPAGLDVLHWLSGFVNSLEEGKGPAVAIATVLGGLLASVALVKVSTGIEGVIGNTASLVRGFGQAGGAVIGFVGKLFAQTSATDAATIATGEQTAATEEQTIAQGEADAAMDANPIGAVILTITALIVVIVEVVKHWKDFKQWGEDAWHAVKDAAEDAWHFLDSNVIHPLEQGLDQLGQSFEQLWHDVDNDFHEIESAVSSVVSHVVGWFERLPGNILHAIGDLGSLLFHAGVNAIDGLLHGMESMVGSAIHTVEGWGHDIVSALGDPFGIHFSDPSEASIMIKAGRRISEGLALGIDAGRSDATASMQRLAQATLGGFGSAGYGTGRGYGGGVRGGGDTYIFQIAPLTNPQAVAREIQQMLLNLKRDRGFKPDSSAGLGLA